METVSRYRAHVEQFAKKACYGQWSWLGVDDGKFVRLGEVKHFPLSLAA